MFNDIINKIPNKKGGKKYKRNKQEVKENKFMFLFNPNYPGYK